MKKSTLIQIMQICSLVNLVLGYASLVTATPDEAICYFLASIWILVLALSIK